MSRTSTNPSPVALFLLCALLLGGLANAQDAAQVPFPKGFREWTRVKSALVLDEKHPLFKVFSGFTHIYANPKALAALKSNGPFENGAAFVLDVLEVSDSSGAISEGPRKQLAVMVRDTERYKATGGWGFQTFQNGKKEKPRIKTVADAKACLDCHQQRANQRLIFSELSQ